MTEMVVPVEWLAARPVEEAFRAKGLFASQVTACKLRDTHTIETVESAFGLNTEISELNRPRSWGTRLEIFENSPSGPLLCLSASLLGGTSTGALCVRA